MPPSDRVAFEVCVESAAGLAACAGLADRVELCAALDVGGLTPSPGLMEAAKRSGLAVHVLIRPRSGDFQYDNQELETMLHDIAAVRGLGLSGIVIGAAQDGALDSRALAQMKEAAGDLCVTLHRVIDVIDDPLRALDEAIDLGIDRVLTSGGAANAHDGRRKIARMVAHANRRIEVMAGAGITSNNLHALLEDAQVDAVHASCRAVQVEAKDADPLGFGQAARQTSRDEVQKIRLALDQR